LETEEKGLEIGGDVGMRMKVMEFWKCSETGLASGKGDESGDEDTLKIVIGESLPEISKF
jgi:hypothetical protein